MSTRRGGDVTLRTLDATSRAPLPIAFVVFLALQVAFLGCLAWAWLSHPGIQKAFANATNSGIPTLRLAGSNTIGAELGPALAQDFLKHLGAVDIQLRNGTNDEEHIVSGTLPGTTSPAVITISAHGSATAFTSFATNRCDVGMASRKIKEEEAHTLSTLGDLTSSAAEHVLGLDGIAVIVNAANPAKSLTVDQIADIFSGKISDWSELGGPAGTIRIFARDDKSGTYDTFKTLVLGSKPLTAAARRFEDSNQLSDAVAAEPNGIGFIGLPYIHSAKAISVAAAGAKPLFPNSLTVATEDYPLSRRLYLYTPVNLPNQFARDFVEFAISKQGQNVVANKGFISQNLELDRQAAAQDAPAEYKRMIKNAERLSVNFRFRTGRSDLDNKALVDLDRMASFFGDLKYGGDRILLLGFSDNNGDRLMNVQLSQQRARMVAEQFEQRGLKASVVDGFGPELPVASNETNDGRERNRRVEVWLKPSDVSR